jgi:hypothetical protein
MMDDLQPTMPDNLIPFSPPINATFISPPITAEKPKKRL